MKVTLKINLNGNIIEKSLSSGKVLGFGRSSKCHVQLDDEKISGKHCQLHLQEQRLELKDLDSKNGTYLNGIRIEQSEVFLGDEIKIGDTFITLEENTCDSEALEALAFPGHAENRLDHALKADFTGARIQNQLKDSSKNGGNRINVSRAQEIDVRRRISSHLKLSKQEIRARNRLSSFLASVVDVSVIFLFLLVPFILIGKIMPEGEAHTQALFLFLLIQGACLMIFYFVNFKTAKFTIGESICGIKKLYEEQ